MQLTPLSIIIISIVATISSLGIAIILVLKIRSEKKSVLSQIADLEIKLNRFHQDIEALTKKDIEQAGKITWLESRVRSGNIAKEENFQDKDSCVLPGKLSLTERRHRILSLARRGLDTNTISTMLGTPHGEVELVIGLNRNI
ncbi:MAG: hypothetical protein WAQ98_33210 [Blastocatellia bacterium]